MAVAAASAIATTIGVGAAVLPGGCRRAGRASNRSTGTSDRDSSAVHSAVAESTITPCPVADRITQPAAVAVTRTREPPWRSAVLAKSSVSHRALVEARIGVHASVAVIRQHAPHIRPPEGLTLSGPASGEHAR